VTDYSFVTRWQTDAPIAAVIDVLKRVDEWPDWWHGVDAVEQVAAGDAQGIGATHRFTFRGRLPYSLVFSIRVTQVIAPHRLAGVATGELEGTGIWTLRNGDGSTHIEYDWDVRTTRWWMNLLAPVARPVFIRNHDAIMEWGRIGLGERLGTPVHRETDGASPEPG
jgi:hypothetical protein